ncbi:Ferredoxin-1 [Candidatus Nitrosocosmicus franklandus]|uniref:Ferredoxin-1 n=2 Tax=Candidatus Nitrosocosmicus franklandianus TaxID=1798806 RepID=A0A484I9U9_9ARCH|nr:Ferredoxin-1 [Candidatus Nitrosocosmicus franklandus]
MTEYICEDCGSLLTHLNPTTLQSIKEVHSQLCPVKRQKILATAEAEKLKRASSSRNATIPMQAVQTAAGAPPSAASIPQQVATTPSSNEAADSSSLKLTGTGTDHVAAEGPIDTGFKSKRQPAGKFKGIQVWGPYDPPGQLGIWGTDVCVDFDICISDGACIDACPVNVYEWLETPGHPASERKPFMIREKDCIFCLACENVCPPQAIKIFKK